MLDQSFGQPLGDSGWAVYEARSILPQLIEVSDVADDKYAAEHFLALCSYLDQLLGTDFDRLLPVDRRRIVTEHVRGILGRRPTGMVDAAEDEDDLVEADLADVDIDTVIRLDQPVNSPLTLAEGREIGGRLAGSSGWQGDLGRALTALYAYLDDLHGGTGRFTELLTTAERADVAGRVVISD